MPPLAPRPAACPAEGTVPSVEPLPGTGDFGRVSGYIIQLRAQSGSAPARAVARAPSEDAMFGKRIPLFHLFGIEIRLDLSWILIAVLITWTLSSGVFPGYYPNLAPATYWTMGVIAAAGLFASIVL